MNNLKNCLCIMFLILLSTPDLKSADVGIICDVSKSMRSQWLNEGKAAIIDLIIDGKIRDGWDFTSSQKQTIYPFIRDQKSPTQPGNTLLILKFGTVKIVQFPYFKSPAKLKISDINQLRSFINVNFPAKVTDEWTYMTLAESVTSEIMQQELNSKRWFLIILSDLVEDRGFTLTSEQIDLIDKYESIKDQYASKSMILTWNSNSKLKIRITEIVLEKKVERSRVMRLLAPQNGRKFSRKNNNITFSWKWDSEERYLGNYTFVLRKAEGRDFKLASTRRLPRTRYTQQNLKSGKYHWYVTANTDDGFIRSTTRKFQIKGSNPIGFILICLVLAGIIIYGMIKTDIIQKVKNRLRRKDGTF